MPAVAPPPLLNLEAGQVSLRLFVSPLTPLSSGPPGLWAVLTADAMRREGCTSRQNDYEEWPGHLIARCPHEDVRLRTELRGQVDVRLIN